jgi:type I restriction enzyme, S subunit
VTLPANWVEATIGEFIGRTQTLDPRDCPDEIFDLYSVPSYSDYEPETPEGREIGSSKQIIQQGDVLLCKIVPHIRRSWVVPEPRGKRQIASGEWIVFRNHGLEPEYIRRFVLSDVFHDQFMRTVSGVGGSLMRARPSEAAEILIPLPPLAEQRRIVAKLDTLTARLRRARTELDRVAAMAKAMRQSTLSRAFSGMLTRSFRGDASVSGVFGFPACWTVERLDEISEIQGGIQVGKQRPHDVKLIVVPYLRVANVQRGWLKLDEIKTISVTSAEKERLLLKAGDILMNEGGDRDKLGRGWVWYAQIDECIHQNHVFRIRLKDRSFPAEFVSHYANENGQQYFLDQGTQTTNLASISKKRVGALPVPLPPTAEAYEITRLISVAFARADRLEAEAARARALLDRLEAAILARAFRGELVPQDPSDEPAAALLARIRAERATAPKAKRGRRSALPHVQPEPMDA